MEEDDKGTEYGGGEATGVRIFSKYFVQSVFLFGADVDSYTYYGTGPGRFPGLGGVVTDGADPMAEDIR